METERTTVNIVYTPIATLYPAQLLEGTAYPTNGGPSWTTLNTSLLLPSRLQKQPVDFKVLSETLSLVPSLGKDNMVDYIVKCSQQQPDTSPSRV